jgi:cobalt-zinc-cadmium efflux system outer membrane protein
MLSHLRYSSFIFGAVFFLSSCASAPPKGLATITQDGVSNRTGFSLNPELYLGKQALPPGITLDHELSSDEAAAIALWNNPQFGADLASLGLARGDLIDAGQIRNPRLDLIFPVGAKPFELLLNLPIEAIWERPARVEAAAKAYEQLAQSLVQNALNTIQEARIAHANLALAHKREAILENTAELRKRIARMTKNERVRTGQLTTAEGIATEVDSASAEELWVRAKHDTLLAMERFRLALGLMFSNEQFKVKSLAVLPTVASSEDLIKKALESRPDLKALELGIQAAAKRAGWESTRITQLSLLLNTKDVGTHRKLSGPGFSAEIPIFHRNEGRRARADAEVEMVTMQFLALKQRVVFEVKEARELFLQNQEVLLRTKRNVLPLVEKTVAIAEREYRRGAASYLFVLEQTRSLVDTQLREADFAAAVLRADAQLKRAVGGN